MIAEIGRGVVVLLRRALADLAARPHARDSSRKERQSGSGIARLRHRRTDPLRSRGARHDPPVEHASQPSSGSTATASPSVGERPSPRRRARERPMADAPHIMIVEAPYYAHIAEELARGAIQARCRRRQLRALHRAGAPSRFRRPSASPSRDAAPAGTRASMATSRSAASSAARPRIYDYVCAESARGLQLLALQYGVPPSASVSLHVENEAQHWRARGSTQEQGRRGVGGCLAMIELRPQFGLQKS